MLNSASFRYYRVQSIIHNLHPVIKVIVFFLLVIMTFFLHDVMEYIIYSIVLLLIMLLSNVAFKMYLKQIRSVSVMLFIVMIFNTLFGVTFMTSFTIVVKVLFVIFSSSILLFTTLPNDINYAFEKILSPLKKILPVSSIAMILSLAISFIPTIEEEVDRILMAEASRGLDIKSSSIKEKVSAIRHMLLPTFMLTLKRSDDVSDIMALRLYGTNENKTRYKEYFVMRNDIYILGSLILLTFLMIVR